jgi:hypothetical protein
LLALKGIRTFVVVHVALLSNSKVTVVDSSASVNR